MDALYTEEERLLKSTMREFADSEIAPNAARWDENEEFPWASVEAMKRMGLMGMTAKTAHGGAGASYAELAIAAEEIARVCMTTSTTLLAHLSLGVSTIDRFANEEQAARFFPAITSGEKIVAWALSEPSSGSDAADMQTTAVKRGDDCYVLNGSKIFITNAEQSGLMVVFTATDRSLGNRGTTAFVVDSGSPGIEMRGMHGKLGIRGSGTAEVYFTDVEVPAADRLGEEGEGFKIAMTVLDSSRISLATQSVGLAQGAFEAAVTVHPAARDLRPAAQGAAGHPVHAVRHGDADRRRAAAHAQGGAAEGHGPAPQSRVRDGQALCLRGGPLLR